MCSIALNERGEALDAVHVVLLGDSTLDNGRYLNWALGELSVEKQLAAACEQRGWKMTKLAQDGAMLSDVLAQQLPLMPPEATHVVLSCSGNDLLALLNQMVVARFGLGAVYKALGEGLKFVAEQYRELVHQLLALRCHVACCTVYTPNFNALGFKILANYSLSLHNSRLVQIAEDLGCSILDLANVIEGDADFANPLELSTRGGSKVVQNITDFVGDHAMPQSNTLFEMIRAENVAASTACGVCVMPKCCVGGAPGQSIYSNKVTCCASDTPEWQFAGDLPGRPLSFSEAQECWRKM